MKWFDSAKKHQKIRKIRVVILRENDLIKEVKMGDTVEETNLSENSNPNPNPESESERETLTLDGTSFNTNNQREILKAIEVVERDSLAIAQSFTSVFEALRLSLSQSTDTSIHHIQCFADAAGHLQESGIRLLFLKYNDHDLIVY